MTRFHLLIHRWLESAYSFKALPLFLIARLNGAINYVTLEFLHLLNIHTCSNIWIYLYTNIYSHNSSANSTYSSYSTPCNFLKLGANIRHKYSSTGYELSAGRHEVRCSLSVFACSCLFDRR